MCIGTRFASGLVHGGHDFARPESRISMHERVAHGLASTCCRSLENESHKHTEFSLQLRLE